MIRVDGVLLKSSILLSRCLASILPSTLAIPGDMGVALSCSWTMSRKDVHCEKITIFDSGSCRVSCMIFINSTVLELGE